MSPCVSSNDHFFALDSSLVSTCSMRSLMFFSKSSTLLPISSSEQQSRIFNNGLYQIKLRKLELVVSTLSCTSR